MWERPPVWPSRELFQAWKFFRNSDLLQSHSSLAFIFVIQLIRIFAQCTAVELPCTVQNFKISGRVRKKLIQKQNFARFSFQDTQVSYAFPLLLHLQHTRHQNWSGRLHSTGIILGIWSANERRCNVVTSFLIGWAHVYNDPCSIYCWV